MRAVYEPLSHEICHRFYDNGGCTFCYFNALKRCVSASHLTLKERINHFDSWAEKNQKKIEDKKGILVASCGSFFPQLPHQLRNHIYEYLDKHKGFDLAFEIRATMYNPERAKQEFERVSDKVNVEQYMEEVQSGIKELKPNHIAFFGLEVADNDSLKILNKGCTLKDYEYASKLIHKMGARIGVNILLNPPGIQDPIRKALQTVDYAADVLKTDEMHMFACIPGAPSKAYYSWRQAKWNPFSASLASEITRQTREKYSPFPDYISIVRAQWFTGKYGKFKLKNRTRTEEQKQRDRAKVRRVIKEMNWFGN